MYTFNAIQFEISNKMFADKIIWIKKYFQKDILISINYQKKLVFN